MRSTLTATFWFLFGFACLAALLLASYDLFVENPALQVQAREAACAVAQASSPPPAPPPSTLAGPSVKQSPPPAPSPPVCSVELRRWEAGLFRRIMEFEGSGGRVWIRCTRKYVVLGDQECRPLR